ncbi:hypothetical protein BHM03_00036928 [Ensete ventricosum]|nr:hypothetical protein BHM03_00036928 [Ensete ventricosum]
MTKQNVVMQEELAVAVPTAAAIAEPSPCFSYPPPRAVGSGTNYTRYTKLSCRLDLASCGGRAANSWIESMKALSPTQAKSAGQREVPSLASREEEDYDSWQVSVRFCLILLWLLNKHLRIRTQMLHPSALDNFEEVMTASKGKQIVMFLDYDGTLSPIVDDPDRAFMSDEVRTPCLEADERGSKRGGQPFSNSYREWEVHREGTFLLLPNHQNEIRLFHYLFPYNNCFWWFPFVNDQVSSFVKLSELYYAGSHGMDIKGPNNGPKHPKAMVGLPFSCHELNRCTSATNPSCSVYQFTFGVLTKRFWRYAQVLNGTRGRLLSFYWSLSVLKFLRRLEEWKQSSKDGEAQ